MNPSAQRPHNGLRSTNRMNMNPGTQFLPRWISIPGAARFNVCHSLAAVASNAVIGKAFSSKQLAANDAQVIVVLSSRRCDAITVCSWQWTTRKNMAKENKDVNQHDSDRILLHDTS